MSPKVPVKVQPRCITGVAIIAGLKHWSKPFPFDEIRYKIMKSTFGSLRKSEGLLSRGQPQVQSEAGPADGHRRHGVGPAPAKFPDDEALHQINRALVGEPCFCCRLTFRTPSL